jgi:HK97 gp10 family phage protein
MIRGIPQTKAALERVKFEVTAAAPGASRAGGEVVAHNMASRAPRATGRLASSISVDVSGDTARVGANVPYDRFVQRGTTYMSPQPYGEQAASETSGVITAIAAVLKAAIR